MLDLLRRRRSIRRFLETPVEQEKVDQLIKAALLSPSSRGLQPWEFIVVQDREMLGQLSLSKTHGSSFLRGAPLGIVVLADPNRCDVWIEDASIATLILHLTAEALGLGSCWIQIRERWHDQRQSAADYIKELLRIPEGYEVEAMVAMGYPAEHKPQYRDDQLQYQKVHYELYCVK